VYNKKCENECYVTVHHFLKKYLLRGWEDSKVLDVRTAT
jgi:hypothetical protein